MSRAAPHRVLSALLHRRRRAARGTAVRLAAPGQEPRALAPGDPAAQALVAAAEAVLSAAQRGARG